MARTRRRYLGAVAGAVALAGCQSASNDTTPSDGADATDAAGTDAGGTDTEGTDAGAGMGADVKVREHAEFGQILTDAEGLTLYMFDADTQGSGQSSCSGGCLDAWPALTVDGEATASEGVTTELTTFERDGDAMQVAANGWPLYYYANDGAPGDVSGQGVNDVWWVLDPAGAPIRSTAGSTATSTEDSSQQY